uniref:thioredoxin-disulfide reductase (NADPH) n=1 Tax=Euglena gracilis TaxID=3039 RepID=W8VZ54_EUGGR|nr:NADPH-dependent thioredoxin reductase [Euglena gracilis]
MTSYDYDYVVIGGGSGGMASSKEAARLGARVALFDFVKPSTQGTKWGLGGTCVNVGCVPKKLMHYAGLLGAGLHDARHFGWRLGEPTHDWTALRTAVQNHVKSLNFGYRNGLRSAKVNYLNQLARFADPHTVEYTEKDGSVKRLTAAHICISVGGRPIIPTDVPGAVEHAITSDDIFALKNAPGRTLVVGASYIALECAGFLNELGYDVTVAVRSIVLRGFDRQCSEKVASLMADIGVKFKYGPLPTKIEKADGQLHVTFSDGTVDTYQTVLYATGRYADTGGLALENAGVVVGKNGKIPVINEVTNVPHIYAVGDIVEGGLELTPVAIRAGELLARRLFAGATEQMDYVNVPTAVFTPFEYGCVGYTEEAAIAKYGEENIETYLFEFASLELGAAHRSKVPARRADEFDDALPLPCLSKLVCLKPEGERVVGFHYVGPNAGEVTQGFALAVILGATKKDFNKVIGIHPTDAESFTALDITRASGQPFAASGGCGGGKCG